MLPRLCSGASDGTGCAPLRNRSDRDAGADVPQPRRRARPCPCPATGGNVLYLVHHMTRWVLLCVSERQRRIRTFLPLGPGAWLRQRNGDRLPVGTVIDATISAYRQAIRAPLAPPRSTETSGAYRARIEAVVTERIARLRDKRPQKGTAAAA